MMRMSLSPKVAFALVSFFLGELGDGLNIFQVSPYFSFLPAFLVGALIDVSTFFSDAPTPHHRHREYI